MAGKNLDYWYDEQIKRYLIQLIRVFSNFKVKSEHLKELHGRAKALIFKIENFTIEHVYRENNKRADELANLALDK